MGSRTFTHFGIAAVCVAVGAGVTTIPASVSIVILAVGLAALALGAIRTLVDRLESAPSDHRAQHDDRPRGVDGLWAPRMLYYAGSGTLCLLTVRPAFSTTLSDLFFLAAAALAVAQLVVLGRIRDLVPPIPRLMIVGLALFSVGGLIATFGATFPQSSAANVGRVAYLTIIWFWLGSVLLPSYRYLARAISLWLFSAGVCAAGAILQLIYGDVLPGVGPVAHDRMTGFTGGANLLGGLAAIAFVPTMAFAWHRGLRGASRRSAAVFAPLVVILAAGVILSGSVGSLLALIVGVFGYLAMVRLSGRALVSVVAIVAVLGLASAFATAVGGTSPLHRFSTTVGPSDAPNGTSTLSVRIAGYQDAWKRIERNPIVGVGLDSSSSTTPSGHQVHNIALLSLYEAGLVGLVGICLVFASVLRLAASILRSGDLAKRGMAKGLLGGFLSMVVYSMSEPVLYQRFCWVPVAMLLALRGESFRDRSSKLLSPPPTPSHANFSSEHALV